MAFKVIGNHTVHGVEPGGTLPTEGLEDDNINMLIEAGHIDGGNTKKKEKE